MKIYKNDLQIIVSFSLVLDSFSKNCVRHLLIYVLSLVSFYTAAPLSLCCNHIPEVYNYSVNGVAEFIVKGKKYTMQDLDFNWLEFTSSLLKLGWLQWIGAAIFFWGWIHQRRCHDILVCVSAAQRLCNLNM